MNTPTNTLEDLTTISQIPSHYCNCDACNEHRVFKLTDLERYVSEAVNKALKPTWWVTEHHSHGVRRVAGAFTTATDAGNARQILEENEGHHNYWIEELETPNQVEGEK